MRLFSPYFRVLCSLCSSDFRFISFIVNLFSSLYALLFPLTLRSPISSFSVLFILFSYQTLLNSQLRRDFIRHFSDRCTNIKLNALVSSPSKATVRDYASSSSTTSFASSSSFSSSYSPPYSPPLPTQSSPTTSSSSSSNWDNCWSTLSRARCVAERSSRTVASSCADASSRQAMVSRAFWRPCKVEKSSDRLLRTAWASASTLRPDSTSRTALPGMTIDRLEGRYMVIVEPYSPRVGLLLDEPIVPVRRHLRTGELSTVGTWLGDGPSFEPSTGWQGL